MRERASESGVSEEVLHQKQLSDEVFVISRIIKVKVARLSAEAKARG